MNMVYILHKVADNAPNGENYCAQIIPAKPP